MPRAARHRRARRTRYPTVENRYTIVWAYGLPGSQTACGHSGWWMLSG